MSTTTASGTCTWTYHAGSPGYWTVVSHCTSGSCTADPAAKAMKLADIKVERFEFARKTREEFTAQKRTLTKGQADMLDAPKSGDEFPMDCV